MEVQVKCFAFILPSGGTGMSTNCSWVEPYPNSTAKIKITKGWWDYECGYRFIGESACPELAAYLEAHGSKEDRRVFVSELELADRRDLGPLIDSVLEEAVED